MVRDRLMLITGATLVLAAASLLSACGAASEATDGNETAIGTEAVGQVESPAIGTACSSYDTSKYDNCLDIVDSSGYVHTRVYQCKPSAPGETPVAVCGVEDDKYVLVGGGFNTADVDLQAGGAFMVGSFPLEPTPKPVWVAITDDHKIPDVHTVTAFAIGLRLDTDKNGQKVAYSTDSLRSQVTFTTRDSGAAETNPVKWVPIPDQHLLLGGGARVDGALLITDSRPSGTHGWYARAKQHAIAATGTVYTTAISIPTCPSGLSYCLRMNRDEGTNSSGPGWQGTTIFTSSAFAMTGIGAIANSADQISLKRGRLIGALLPSANLMAGWTSDHIYTEPGSTTSYIVGIARQ